MEFRSVMHRQELIAQEVKAFFKSREEKMQHKRETTTVSTEPQSAKPSCDKPPAQSDSAKRLRLPKIIEYDPEKCQVSDIIQENEDEESSSESPQYSPDDSPHQRSSEFSEGSFVKNFDSSPSESQQSDESKKTFKDRIYEKYLKGFFDIEPEVNNEWFYNALTRYRQLIQWEIETSVIYMDNLGEDLVSFISNKDNVHSIGYVNIDSLQCDPKSRRIEKQYLHMPNLLKSKQKILKMKAVPYLNMILATLENHTGLAVYKVNYESEEEAGQISLNGFLESQYMSPNFTYNVNHLILSNAAPDPLVLYDLSTGIVKGSIPFPCQEGPMEPFFVAPNLFGVCYTNWGSYGICDLRSNGTVINFAGEGKSRTAQEFWIPSSSYEATCTVSNNVANIPLYVGLLSSSGRVLIYDVRKDSTTYCESYLNKSVALRNKRYPGISMKFCPNDPKKISISGFDDRVTVYELSSSDKLKEIFEHSGHYNQHGCSPLCTTTDHYWLDSDIIISAADNRSLQMWQYIPSS